MGVAENTAFPAAEAMPGHGHRDRHVDADHADLDASAELARHVPVAGIAGDAVGEGMRVDELDRGGEVRHPDATEHRAEDLLLVDAHRRRHAVEEGGTYPEAALLTGDGEGSPTAVHSTVDHELGARG